jgi:hypothetical protein
MQVHIFRGPARVFGFTGDAMGTSLPAQYAPWNHFKTLEMSRGEAIPGVNSTECLDDIERIMPKGPVERSIQPTQSALL